MTRFAQPQQFNKAYAAKTGGGQSLASLQNRGQNGYLTDFSFVPSSTDYVTQPLIIKVLRAPTGLGMMPEGNLYIQAYVNLLETMVQSWTGFNKTLSVSVAETDIGRNEKMQTPTRVSRARSQPQCVIPEKDNLPVIRFLDDLVRYTIMDPEVGHPLLTGVNPNFKDRLADIYGADIIAYEPDKTFQYVNRAFLLTNFYPFNEIGDQTAGRQLQADGETRQYTISWTGIQKVGYAVDRLAQRFMDNARVTGIDPAYQPAFIGGMRADVAAVNTGGLAQINQLKQQMAQVS